LIWQQTTQVAATKLLFQKYFSEVIQRMQQYKDDLLVRSLTKHKKKSALLIVFIIVICFRVRACACCCLPLERSFSCRH